MRFLSIIFLSLCICPASLWAYQDSTRIEKEGDKTFILHRVDEKETLYSLSRKYDVPIYKIIEQNPPTEFGLEIGQTLRIPVIEKSSAMAEPVQPVPVQNEKSSDDVQKESKPIVTTTGKTGHTIHFVEEKQTLFSISRLYNVSVADIKDWNNLKENDLKIGQELIIKEMPQGEKTPVPVEVAFPGSQVHIVSPSETLYSISKKYEIALADLKDWNQLTTNDITIGQRLIIADPANRGPIAGTNEDLPRETVTPTPSEEPPGDREAIDRSIEAAREYEEKSSPMNFEEVVESGLAVVIEGTEDTRKYLALHRTAKIGTILRVKNDMNNQEVFVRVLGKLPGVGADRNVLIKLSKAAYDRLGAIDPKFRVTLSYIP